MVGVGIDAVDIDRFRAALARTPSLARRVFTDAERAYAEAAVDPVPRLAVRFAAKEAVMKVLGVGLGAFRFHDVEVVRDPASGAPSLSLVRQAARLAERRGARCWHISLTHTDRSAQAVVIAE